MKPDLDSIYAELDIDPRCSLADFKRAYRRRIAELHPDREGTRSRNPEDEAVLRNLIRVYAAVTRFHRRYGRMPGGHPAHLRAPGLPRFARVDRGVPAVEPGRSGEARRTRATMTLVGLFIALVLLLASWSWLGSAAHGNAGRGATPAQPPGPGIPFTAGAQPAVATRAACSRPVSRGIPQREPRLKSTTSTVCNRIIRSNTSPWFLT